MDPNKALDRARRALSGALTQDDRCLEALAEAFEALDLWLSKGGSLPDAWSRAALKKQSDKKE